MAIVFQDYSRCPLCNRVLNKEEEYILFPPFMGNKKDPLFVFSDSGVHVDCLNKNPPGKLALSYLEKFDENIPSVKSKSSIDGQVISTPENIVAFGLLTSDPQEELFKFNFMTLDKVNIKEWAQREEFIRVASKFSQEGKWEGTSAFNYLDFLLNLMNM